MAEKSNTSQLTIGMFAKAAGVNVETIRYYQSKGLLTTPDKPYGGIRRYQQRDIFRVNFIKTAQRLGFTLDDISQLLYLDEVAHCHEVASMASKQLEQVVNKINALKAIECSLTTLLATCHLEQNQTSCPLTQALYDHRL